MRFHSGWGSTPYPAGGAYSAPSDPIAGFKGPTYKGREARKEGREWTWKGVGTGRTIAALPPLSAVNVHKVFVDDWTCSSGDKLSHTRTLIKTVVSPTRAE